MRAAFAGWTLPLNLTKVVQRVVNGLVKEIFTAMNCTGVIQPLKLRDIKQYPEGQWSWTWYQIHIVGPIQNLDTNDKIIYDGQKYKVMGVFPYKLNNYTEYHIVQDFE